MNLPPAERYQANKAKQQKDYEPQGSTSMTDADLNRKLAEACLKALEQAQKGAGR